MKTHTIRFTTKQGFTARKNLELPLADFPTVKEVAAHCLPLARSCDSYTFTVEHPKDYFTSYSTDYGQRI